MAYNELFALAFVAPYLASGKRIPPQTIQEMMRRSLYHIKWYFARTDLNTDRGKAENKKSIMKYVKWYTPEKERQYPTSFKVDADAPVLRAGRGDDRAPARRFAQDADDRGRRGLLRLLHYGRQGASFRLRMFFGRMFALQNNRVWRKVCSLTSNFLFRIIEKGEYLPAVRLNSLAAVFIK